MTAVVTCSNWLPIFMRWWQLWMKTTTIKQRYGMNLFIVVFHPFVLVPNSMSKLMYNRYRYKLILRSGHTTFSENSSNFLATTSAIQYKWYSRVQKLASNFKFRRGNHLLLADNVFYINLNVICAVQIILATLLVISISELKSIEPPPLMYMGKVATKFQTLSFWSSSPF